MSTNRMDHWKRVVFGDETFTAATYSNASVTVDSFGQVTSISSGVSAANDVINMATTVANMLLITPVKRGDVVTVLTPKSIYKAIDSISGGTVLSDWQLISTEDYGDILLGTDSVDKQRARRGDNASILAYVPADGEFLWDSEFKQFRVGDDSTSGGILISGSGGGSTSTISKKSASFTVAEVDGMDHHYSVVASGVVVTIPTGLSTGFRFQVRCLTDTTFVLAV